MSAQQRSDEEREPQAQSESDEQKKNPSAPEPKKPAGINYVFKFAPANPKNTLDFEDVADK